jgi:hypothetical protein
MSDYITTLRQDLVEAAERQQRRSPAARLARPAHPRNWSPLAVLGAATALATVLVVVIGLRAIEPAPRPTDAQIVSRVHLGGQPRDAVAVGDSLVIVDSDGRVVKVSPTEPGARTELDLRGETAASVAADGDAVWVVAESRFAPPRPGVPEPPPAHLFKFDVRSGRVLARVPLHSLGDAIRAGAIGAWLPTYFSFGTALVPPLATHVDEVGALVVARGSAWARSGGRLVELDPRGRIARQVRGISDLLTFSSLRTIVPDASGAWVLGQAGAVLYRVDGDRVTRRIKVGVSAGVLARAGTDVWVSAISSPGHYELVRVDGDSGRIMGRVRLGRTAPQTIVPVGDQLWVVTSGGDALLVNPE